MLDSVRRRGLKSVIGINVAALVDRNYPVVANLSGGSMTAEEVEAVVAGFGQVLVLPPRDALDGIEVHELEDPEGRPRVRARIALWTVQGASDLILEQEEVNDITITWGTVNLRFYRLDEDPDTGSVRWRTLAELEREAEGGAG